jgi:Domain of unknown function (DUF4396)
MVIGTALGWSDAGTIALAVVLAFFFGYSMTIVPLLRSRLALGAVVGIALAADTVSITIMEINDNAIMVAIPGAMEAGLANLLFWGSLAFSLIVAFIAAFPVNRWLIARGRGHAVVHEHHTHQVATSISAGPARAGGTGSPCGSLSPARSRLYDLLSGVAKSGTGPDLRQAIRKIRPNRRGRLASSAIVFTGPTEPPGRVSPTETLRGRVGGLPPSLGQVEQSRLRPRVLAPPVLRRRSAGSNDSWRRGTAVSRVASHARFHSRRVDFLRLDARGDVGPSRRRRGRNPAPRGVRRGA